MKPLILTVTDSNFVGIASPKPCSGTLSFVTQLEESPHKLTDDIMTKHTIRLFSADFKLEATQLVLDQNYSVVEAAKAMNIGESTMDKWVSQLKEEHNEILKKATALLISDSLNNF